MNQSWDEVLQIVARYHELFAGHRSEVMNAISLLPPPTLPECIQILDTIARYSSQLSDPTPEEIHAFQLLLEPLLAQLKHLQSPDEQQQIPADLDQPLQEVCDQLAKLYQELGKHNPIRHHLLRALVTTGTTPAFQTFSELIVTDPPSDEKSGDIAFVPLWQQDTLPIDILFPRLLDGIIHQPMAALILDLANHVTRLQLVDKHPAASRMKQLAELFSGLANQLKRLEEKPSEYAQSATELSEIVSNCVSLGVALADALGLIGNPDAVGALRKGLEIGHRRLRAESAAALARLDQKEGIEVLVGLASDPGSRLRALAYLEELNQLDEVLPEHRSEDAKAEAELAAFLSQSTQFGLPPSELHILDTRDLKWPGKNEPEKCFLIRYLYQFPQQPFWGIGLVGPMTFSFRKDLSTLDIGTLYALYCGWHVQHPEIVVEAISEEEKQKNSGLETVIEAIGAHGYEEIDLEIAGRFFGREFYIGRANNDQGTGFVILEEETLSWYPATGSWIHFTCKEAAFVHLGKQILVQFNPEESLFTTEANDE